MLNLTLAAIWLILTLGALHLQTPEPEELQDWTWEKERDRVKESLSAWDDGGE